MMHTLCCIAASAIVLVSAGHAQTIGFQVRAKGIQTFNTQDELGRNQVVFRSKAPMEDIFGAAAGVSGKISFDPADPAGSIRGVITVQVASMTTGLKQRDRDMLGEQWLDVGRYRTITFRLRKLTETRMSSYKEITGTATGDFTMHGVTRTISIPLSLTYLEESPETLTRGPGDLLVLRSAFSVRFEDYNISAVKNVIGFRVAKSIDLDISVVATNHVYPENAELER